MPLPSFKDCGFLREHVVSIFNFYYPKFLDDCEDGGGGFFHYLMDDGTVYNKHSRHLVSSTRLVVNFVAMILNDTAVCSSGSKELLRSLAQQALDFLVSSAHRHNVGGKEKPLYAYRWVFSTEEDPTKNDDTNHAYGLAFVMLALSMALKLNLEPSKIGFTTRELLDDVVLLLDAKYFDQDYGLYKDEYDESFTTCSSYRGQNANMHMCEAFIAAYEATGDEFFLGRALLLASNVTGRLASLNEKNLVWEHYSQTWEIDWEYNKENPKHIFRPWGFQTGHQIEWAKLLLTLRRILLLAALEAKHEDGGPLLIGLTRVGIIETCDVFRGRAQEFFKEACRTGWDVTHGGFYYGIAPDESVCDDDKYFWVQAEGIATAALLAEVATSDKAREESWAWYERIWEYCWAHMIDHNHGGWYRILTRCNEKYSEEKSPAGKVDYHTILACCEAIQCLERLRMTNTTQNAE
eukprot:m.29326 g.29326  ORF g.29326 m.29326 type:complete len:464 (+) comp6141_c0_seq1:173-1564(+)